MELIPVIVSMSAFKSKDLQSWKALWNIRLSWFVPYGLEKCLKIFIYLNLVS